MTDEQIIEMARQHFCRVEYDNGNVHECYEFSLEELETFAKLVAQREREACAKVCDEASKAGSNVAYVLAKAIRARGEA